MVIIAYYDCSGLRVFDLITIGGVIIVVTIVLLEIRFSQLSVVYFRRV